MYFMFLLSFVLVTNTPCSLLLEFCFDFFEGFILRLDNIIRITFRFPFYYELKIIFMLWLLLPATKVITFLSFLNYERY